MILEFIGRCPVVALLKEMRKCLGSPCIYGPAAAKKGVREIIIDADCVNGVGSAKVAGSIDVR